jgi:hypothetical protein
MSSELDKEVSRVKSLNSRMPSSVLKALVVAAVMTTVELLTHEPAAVAGAFATTVAALWYGRPARHCLGR